MALRTQLVLLFGAILVTIIALRFAHRQNQQRALGGAISRPKQLWLGLAIFDWFVLAPAIAFDPACAPALAFGLGAFAVSMWIRGAAEMVMLYVTKNWRPPIGISHDLLCIAILLGNVVWHWPAFLTSEGAFDRWTMIYYGKVVVSLCVEIWYAWAFFDAVEGRTTGHDGVWFADENDPKFKRINRVTATFNTIFILTIAVYLSATTFGWPAPF